MKKLNRVADSGVTNLGNDSHRPLTAEKKEDENLLGSWTNRNIVVRKDEGPIKAVLQQKKQKVDRRAMSKLEKYKMADKHTRDNQRFAAIEDFEGPTSLYFDNIRQEKIY